MGGDHKCPVCQATFTRPQHVARHMRSHTGDRPYKCQYCGDQFARSDLLSRHVNKCHATEKPLPNTNARRKGSASASRATTSKQACDQCVQSSLPCDGCNPCSKCVTRKCRCTYVKFHRQTAPAGPGHAARPSVPQNVSALSSVPVPSNASSSSSRAGALGGLYHQNPEDDFILGPPPSSASSSTIPTMAETLYNSNSFAFPPLYPPSTSTASGATGEMAADSMAESYAAKYRAQAGLYGPGRGGGLSTGLTPGMYDPRAAGPSSTAATAASSWLGWDQQDPGDAYQQHPHQHHPQQQQHAQHAQQQQRHSDLIPTSSTSASSSSMHDKNLQAEHSVHQSHRPVLQQQQQQQHLQQQQQQHPSANFMHISMPYPGYMLSSASASTSSGNPANQGPSTTSSRPGTSTGAGHSHAGPGDGDRHGQPQRGAGDPLDLEHALDHGAHAGGGALEFSGSDHGSGAGRSVASSAASSSVHLPLWGGHGAQMHAHGQGQGEGEGMYNTGYHHLGNLPDRAATASTSTTSSSSSRRHQQQRATGGYDDCTGGGGGGYAPHPDERQAEVHSAFGLMSLDDPNVIAGLAADGQPFFSDPAQAHNQDMDTPMPMKRSSGMMQMPSLDDGVGTRTSSAGGASSMTSALGDTPSREADTRELREFWKQYMRTPLSGPGFDLGPSQSSNNSNGSKVSNTASNVAAYRRPRVASLPSAKTPVVERDHHVYDGSHWHSQARGQGQEVDGGSTAKLGPMSSMRTTLHGDQEDLRSYEAAVMARKAPTMLHLQFKRPPKGKGNAGIGLSEGNFGSRPDSAVEAGPMISQTSSSSSLANAFGGNNSAKNVSSSQQPQPSARVTFASRAKEESASPALSSRASSFDGDGDAGGNSPDIDSARPSFKRLPSQTLGPANSKRAFLGYGDDEERIAGWGSDREGNNVTTNTSNSTSTANMERGLGGISHPDRVVASLAERRRRMSAPSTSHFPLDPNAGLVHHQGQGQQHQQHQQGQQRLPQQGQVKHESYVADVPAAGYAPGAQGA